MIDYSNEIFNDLATLLWATYGNDMDIKGEYVQYPTKFPTVTIDEISNTVIFPDSGTQDYARIKVRVQVFSNKKNGKRTEAKNIFKTIDTFMYGKNLLCETYTTTPTIYDSAVYQIQATFEAVIKANGTLYRL